MSSLRAPASPKKPASPRQPLGWRWVDYTRTLVIIDCDGKEESYRVLTLASDFGKSFQLVKVGAESGYYHVHFEGATPTCTCPGGSFRGICKHITSVAALVAGGAL